MRVMMTTRRTALVEAAVAVLAEQGVRGLTHRAVDAAAGLASGSTSNAFRSRQALVEAVLEHILETERAQLGGVPPGYDVDAAVASTVQMARFLLGPGRPFTLARHALFAEAARRPAMRAAVTRATEDVVELVAARLNEAGVREATVRARLLLVVLDGVLLDHLVRPDSAPPLEVVLPALLTSLLTADEDLPRPSTTDTT